MLCCFAQERRPKFGNRWLLADSLISYKEYLDEKTQRIASVHESMTPARQLSEGADIKHVPLTNFVDTKYDLIDRSVKQNGLHSPIMFDEDLHCQHHLRTNGIVSVFC